MSEHEITDEQFEAIKSDIEDTIQYTCGEATNDDEYRIEWEGDTRWAIPDEAVAALAKKHNVSVRAVGREDSIGFVQVVCANADGVIIQNQDIGYAL